MRAHRPKRRRHGQRAVPRTRCDTLGHVAIISKLKAKGLVTERVSESDAKRKQLSLTPHGQYAAVVADDFKSAMADALFGGESATELRAYLRFVTKLETFHAGVVTQWGGEAAVEGKLAPRRSH